MKQNDYNVKAVKNTAAPWFFIVVGMFLLSFAAGLIIIPRSLAAVPTMEVYQQTGRKAFGQETTLDIFSDPKLGGKKLLHPSSKGSYTFEVYNNSSSEPLPYSLDITTSNPGDIPLVFNITKNGEYIFGGEGSDSMLSFIEVNFPEKLLAGKKTDTYVLNWEWKSQDAETDAALGDDGTQFYSLTIKATGSMDETSVPPSSVPNTGDQSNLYLWLLILAVSTAFVLLLFRRRKETDEKGSENM